MANLEAALRILAEIEDDDRALDLRATIKQAWIAYHKTPGPEPLEPEHKKLEAGAVVYVDGVASYRGTVITAGPLRSLLSSTSDPGDWGLYFTSRLTVITAATVGAGDTVDTPDGRGMVFGLLLGAVPQRCYVDFPTVKPEWYNRDQVTIITKAPKENDDA